MAQSKTDPIISELRQMAADDTSLFGEHLGAWAGEYRTEAVKRELARKPRR